MARGIMGAMGNSSKLALALVGLVLGALAGRLRRRPCRRRKTLPSSSPPRCPRSTSDPSPLRGRTPAPPTTSSRKYSRGLTRPSPAVEGRRTDTGVRTATVPLNYTLEGRRRRVEVHRFRRAQEVRRQVADGLEPGHPGPRTGRRRARRLGNPYAARADILGAGEAPLVTYRPVVNVGIDKPALGGADPADSATKLAQLVGVDPAAYAQQVAAAGPRRSLPPSLCVKKDRTITDAQISARFPAPAPSRTPFRWHHTAPSPAPCWAPQPRRMRNRSKSPTGRSRPGTPPAPGASSSNTTRSFAAATASRSSPRRPASRPQKSRLCPTRDRGGTFPD